jgi:hypothetical protein
MPFSRRTSALASFERIVDALEHDVFEGDAPRVRHAGIVAAGLEQFAIGYLRFSAPRLVAQFVAHRVQRDRQHDADLGAGPSIIGTTPEVDSVMRRRWRSPARRRPGTHASASRTASKLYSGSPIPIITMLEMQRSPPVGRPAPWARSMPA